MQPGPVNLRILRKTVSRRTYVHVFLLFYLCAVFFCLLLCLVLCCTALRYVALRCVTLCRVLLCVASRFFVVFCFAFFFLSFLVLVVVCLFFVLSCCWNWSLLLFLFPPSLSLSLLSLKVGDTKTTVRTSLSDAVGIFTSPLRICRVCTTTESRFFLVLVPILLFPSCLVQSSPV